MEKATLPTNGTESTREQNRQIGAAVQSERSRLLDFIRRRVPSEEEAEDIVQDVFYELIEAYRIMKPIEKLTAWLFRVARHKITDRYRKKTTQPLENQRRAYIHKDEEEDTYLLADVLAGPAVSAEDEMMREMILDALAEALDELPPEQKDVFVWHELEDRSFREITQMTGISQNTLLSRKRYAVLYLRQRLQFLYDELSDA
jgi:RNA polymerase sigma factor (sigma-70 family)